MKSESLFYSYDSVFNLLPSILKQRGCKILSMNSREGIIKASHRVNIFKKETGINVKLDKIAGEITTITFWASSDDGVHEPDVLGNDLLEEKLLRTIHKYF